MSRKKIEILLIEDDSNYAKSIQRMLSDLNSILFVHLKLLSDGIEFLKKKNVDIVLLDLFLPDSKGLDTFYNFKTQFPDVPVVIITGFLDDKKATETALRNGAQDYFIKIELNDELLLHSIHSAIERQKSIVQTERDLTRYKTSENNFKNVIERNADGILLVNREGFVIFSNPTATGLFGRKKEELEGEMFGFPVIAGETTEISIVRKFNEPAVAEMRVVEIDWEGETVFLASLRDITERKKAEEEKKELIMKLEESLEKVKTLKGLLPICAWCNKIRDDKGYWNRLENYISERSGAEFSHSICPECMEKKYPKSKKAK